VTSPDKQFKRSPTVKWQLKQSRLYVTLTLSRTSPRNM